MSSSVATHPDRLQFTVTASDPNSQARCGELRTAHSTIQTPVFMPVGTQGTVKALEQRELIELDRQIILGNAYHLYLRPGTATLRTMGGLHAFMNWDRSILTDSGGYQIFSLRALRKLSDAGVVFQSHIDGSSHSLTPESVVEIQRDIGSDIMMVLDECPPNPSPRNKAEEAVRRTIDWARRSRVAFQAGESRYGFFQSQFGIIQGSTFHDLRRSCAEQLSAMDFEGYAIGGLAVGESAEVMYEIVDATIPSMPSQKPRYLMGVGTPANILECIARGVDMFDCVLPTRNARNGQMFTAAGVVNIRNAKYATDNLPVEEGCECYTCSNFSRAYLRHLFIAREILALQLATLHNIAFYGRLVGEAQRHIRIGTFSQWYPEYVRVLQTSNNRSLEL